MSAHRAIFADTDTSLICVRLLILFPLQLPEKSRIGESGSYYRGIDQQGGLLWRLFIMIRRSTHSRTGSAASSTIPAVRRGVSAAMSCREIRARKNSRQEGSASPQRCGGGRSLRFTRGCSGTHGRVCAESAGTAFSFRSISSFRGEGLLRGCPQLFVCVRRSLSVCAPFLLCLSRGGSPMRCRPAECFGKPPPETETALPGRFAWRYISKRRICQIGICFLRWLK